jgi:hypothetical protein
MLMSSHFSCSQLRMAGGITGLELVVLGVGRFDAARVAGPAIQTSRTQISPAAPSKPMVNRPEGKLMKDENEQGPANFLRKENKIVFDRISASIQTLTPE